MPQFRSFYSPKIQQQDNLILCFLLYRQRIMVYSTFFSMQVIHILHNHVHQILMQLGKIHLLRAQQSFM